jgi:hypothetical protein
MEGWPDGCFRFQVETEILASPFDEVLAADESESDTEF